MDTVVRRRRKKLDPDPGVRDALVNAAAEIVRDEGIASVNVARVLDRAALSTRAFYRHFDSKDALVSAVFLQMARIEMRRLKRKMAAASNPAEAVVAWIDGRLDLAFNEQIRSDLRQMSLEAQTQMFAAPELVGDAYAEILKPLVEQLEKGRAAGRFPGHRSGGRRAVDSWSDLGECRTPMDDGRLRSARRSRTDRPFLHARTRCRTAPRKVTRWTWV